MCEITLEILLDFFGSCKGVLIFVFVKYFVIV